MNEDVERQIQSRLPGGARVLDVGGARERARCATHVIDLLSYDEAHRAWEHLFRDYPIPKEHWAVHDICSSKPFPYEDKFFDFVICSHTLEDVRDPIRVCEELSRVSKAGYIEVPSPVMELTMGVEGGERWVGYAHHRWLIDLAGDQVTALFKPHFLTASTRFHLAASHAEQLRKSCKHVASLFWQGEIKAKEQVKVVREELEAEIERIVRSESGDTPTMKAARLRRRAWSAGKQLVESLHMTETIRPLVVTLQKLLRSSALRGN